MLYFKYAEMWHVPYLCIVAANNINLERDQMTITSIIILLAVGLVAGWLAGLIFKGTGFGPVWNIVIGVCGSFLGGFLFNILHISLPFHQIINAIIVALIGALLLLFIINMIRRR
jgi:uncharacterized membrane protein YeaQ/YmgE (transglycosylase-associated protein family)